MDLKEAFTYLSENYQALIKTNATVLGVAYTPDDSDAEFYIIELSLDQEAKEEEGIDYYIVHLEGGNLLSSEGVEDHFGNEDIDSLIQELPEFTQNIQYQVYQLENSPFGNESSFALKTIFPELPDPDDFELTTFKSEAITLITKLNKQ
ncbi:hypothetical protein HCY58_11840 [Acinetobacter radioresistens]|uniref:hypothetical protein n=1 Tax=Acinetobacter radioresistens TaxID=40216 RepID=UPI002006466D|nr:hypothetical protein [Acinetobacter radioresistens]MCK4087738.1 hypothetical protein [Acinetobacter radioresistens]MCK4093477.1 hypothetical protein [Acinetobacter radioresistens]